MPPNVMAAAVVADPPTALEVRLANAVAFPDASDRKTPEFFREVREVDARVVYVPSKSGELLVPPGQLAFADSGSLHHTQLGYNREAKRSGSARLSSRAPPTGLSAHTSASVAMAAVDAPVNPASPPSLVRHATSSVKSHRRSASMPAHSASHDLYTHNASDVLRDTIAPPPEPFFFVNVPVRKHGGGSTGSSPGPSPLLHSTDGSGRASMMSPRGLSASASMPSLRNMSQVQDAHSRAQQIRAATASAWPSPDPNVYRSTASPPFGGPQVPPQSPWPSPDADTTASDVPFGHMDYGPDLEGGMGGASDAGSETEGPRSRRSSVGSSGSNLVGMVVNTLSPKTITSLASTTIEAVSSRAAGAIGSLSRTFSWLRVPGSPASLPGDPQAPSSPLPSEEPAENAAFYCVRVPFYETITPNGFLEAAISGGPVHTMPLRVTCTYACKDAVCDISVQWKRHDASHFGDIPGATRFTYQPSIDDLSCPLYVELVMSTPKLGAGKGAGAGASSSSVVGEPPSRDARVLVKVPMEYLRLDPEVARPVEHLVKSRDARWEVAMADSAARYGLVATAHTITVLDSEGQVVAHEIYSDAVQVTVFPNSLYRFDLRVNDSTVFAMVADNNVMRDIIALVVRSFVVIHVQDFESKLAADRRRSSQQKYRDYQPYSPTPGSPLPTDAAAYRKQAQAAAAGPRPSSA